MTDTSTAQNVEVLQLMGVIGGDNNGAFRPQSNLTRAEFCKMAIELQGRGDLAVLQRERTIFPDVRASHWAAGYVNLATMSTSETAPALMHGNPDGNFAPDRPVTYGEAVTVLVRALGYTDKDSKGMWPQSYISLGTACGLTKGLSLAGDAAISRKQAAQLFVNTLHCSMKDSTKTYIESLGTVGSETTLRDIDFTNGKLKTADGKEYKLGTIQAGSDLVGLKGQVVIKDGKVLTFLPTVNTSGTTVSDAAVIVSADGSTNGFAALTGGNSSYTILKNGSRVTSNALKRWDVATYNAERNIIMVTDTRVTVYYENCSPSATAPTSITTLSGVNFSVVPTAQQSLSAFKPGQQMVILLTVDGRIAGAVAPSSAAGNAFAYVDTAGKARLLCGGTLIADSVGGIYTEQSGKMCRISQAKTGTMATVNLTPQNGSTRGDLNVATKTVGSLKLADSAALISSDGQLLTLGELTEQIIPVERLSYVHTDNSGQVDVVILRGSAIEGEIYGRVTIAEAWGIDEDTGDRILTSRTMTVDCGIDGTIGPFESRFAVKNGGYIAAKYNNDGPSKFSYIVELTKLSNIPSSAWIGSSAVVIDGRTYTVLSSVLCRNHDTQTWFKDLDAAKAYGGTMDLYAKDGYIRVIEVRA